MNSNAYISIPMLRRRVGLAQEGLGVPPTLPNDALRRLKAEARGIFNDLEDGHSVEPSLLAAHVIERNRQWVRIEEGEELRPALTRFVEEMVRLTYPE